VNKVLHKYIIGIESCIENQIVPDKNIMWFRRCTYLLLLLKIFFIWPELPMFYRHAVNIGLGSLMPYRLIFLPLFYNYYNIYWFFASAIVIIALVLNKGNRLLSVAIFIISINYILLVDQSSNGGDNLHNFLIFMLIFIKEGATKRSVRQMVNNTTILIIQMHFCILYFLNAFGKIIRPFWRDGSYFKNLWHLLYYANPNLTPNWFFNPGLNVFTGWAVILFEFIFPIFIWYKPYKKLLIYIGLFFHLGIALFLSLPDFGFTMIIVYILFWDLPTSIYKKKKFKLLKLAQKKNI